MNISFLVTGKNLLFHQYLYNKHIYGSLYVSKGLEVTLKDASASLNGNVIVVIAVVDILIPFCYSTK